jgi:hypothetical protein
MRAAEPWPHASFPKLPRLPLSCARSAGGVVKVNDIFTTPPTLLAELSGSRGGHGALSMRHRRVCELPRHGRTHRSRSCRGCRSVVRAVQEVWLIRIYYVQVYCPVLGLPLGISQGNTLAVTLRVGAAEHASSPVSHPIHGMCNAAQG